MSIIDTLIDKIFGNAAFFNISRIIIHNNFKAEKEIIKKELKNEVNKKVLDFGCGIGQYSTLFSPENYYGIDLDGQCIEFARKNYKGHFILSECNKLPFKNNYFDSIIAMVVLHHISEKDLSLILNE